MSEITDIPPTVYVAECDVGRGVFANRKFTLGEKLLVLTGRTISFSDAVEMGEKEANPVQIGIDAYLDVEAPAVFINHSCEPNAGIVESRILVALRDIRAGEEIRYDYSTTMAENCWTMECRCGAKTCRGIVRDFLLLPPDVQQQYLRLGVVQEFIARKVNHAPPAISAH